MNQITFRIAQKVIYTSSCKYSDVVKLGYTDYNKNNSKEVPLIVMHGLFGARGNWNTMCTTLEQRLIPPRRIIAIDARNHGDSGHSDKHNYEVMSNDVVHFLKEQNIPKMICLGHSMGGRTAMYLTLKFPQLVERLIVVEAGPFNKLGVDKLVDYIKTMSDTPVKTGTLREVRVFVNNFLKRSIEDPRVRAFFLTNLVLKDGTVKWRLNLKALGENYHTLQIFPIDASSGLKYTGPTLFITGGLSDCIVPDDHQTIKEFFPKCKIITVEGAGHNVHADKAEEMRKILKDFLQ